MIAPRNPHLPLLLGELEELERRWGDVERLAAAIAMSLDVEAAAGLLAGRPVDAARLDPREVRRAERKRLVVLRAPIELLAKERAG